MVCGCVSKRKSWLLVLMTMLILMVWQTQGVCIEEERKALLEIKASLIDSHGADLLPAWVDDGSTEGRSGDKCCDWERVTCSTITGHVTNLSLSNMMGMDEEEDYCTRTWPLNVSLFLHFKELTSLNLSKNCLDNNIASTGFERVSLLKKLKVLKLRYNNFMSDSIVASLSHSLPLLKSLDLFDNRLSGPFPAEELSHLTNLEEVDLSLNTFDGTPSIQDCKQLSSLKKLKSISLLGGNKFNKSIILCLSALPFLRTLDLTYTMNDLESSFPAKELAYMTNLEELDLSDNGFNDTPSIQDCRRLSRLETLKSVALGSNNFNKSIISCLNALPSLKILDLSFGLLEGDSFPIQELSGLKELETLDLSGCGLTSLTSDGMAHHLPHLKVLLLGDNLFNGTLAPDAFASFHHLEVLDLSRNNFVGSIPSTIQASSHLLPT